LIDQLALCGRLAGGAAMVGERVCAPAATGHGGPKAGFVTTPGQELGELRWQHAELVCPMIDDSGQVLGVLWVVPGRRPAA
jgi:hypothetical protein